MVRMTGLVTLFAVLTTTMTTTLAAPHAQVPTRVFPRATGGNVTTVNAGANAIGKGQGAQFIGGGCIDDADCGSTCCAGGAISGSTGRAGVGVCSGKGAGVEFQKGKTGCGFQDPNAQTTLAEAAAQVEKQGF